MSVVLVSPTYQIVIPKAIRGVLNLQPGQRIEIMLYQNRIELVPLRPIKSSRGFLCGLDTTIEREPG